MPPTEVEFDDRRGSLEHLAPDVARRRVPRRCGDCAVRREEQHRGIQKRGEPLDDRLPRILLCERIHEVELHRGDALERPQVAAEQRPVDAADDVPERRSQRDAEDGELPLPRLVQQRRRDAFEPQLDSEAERRGPRGLELGDQRALCRRAPAQARARGEHDPLGLQPRCRVLDLDRMRPGDGPAQRIRTAGEKLEPQLLVAQEVPEPERGRCGWIAHTTRAFGEV